LFWKKGRRDGSKLSEGLEQDFRVGNNGGARRGEFYFLL